MNDLTLPGLIVPVEARIDKLEKALKRAAQVQGKAAGAMEKRAKQSADRMAKSYESAGGRMSAVYQRFITPRLAGIAGAAVGIGIGGSITAVRKVLGDMSNLAKEADRVDLSTDAFQGLRHGLNLAGVSTDETTKALEQFVDRLGDAKEGSGDLARMLESSNIALTDSAGNLRPMLDLLRDYADAVKRAPDAAARMKMMTDAFGKGGKSMVMAFSQGGSALDQWIAEAKQGGFVIEEELLRRAEKLDDQFAMLADRLGNVFKRGVVEAATFFGFVERERAKLEFDPDAAARLFGKGTADALGALPEVPADVLAQIESLATEYANLADEARQLVPALSDASTMLRGVGDEAGATALTALATRIGEAARAFDEGEISGTEYAEALKAVVAEAEASLTAMSDLDQARLAGVIAQVQSLLEWIRLIPGAAADARAEVNNLALTNTGIPLTDDGNLLPPSPNAPRTSPRPKEAPAMLGEPELPKPARGGKGGGGQDDFASAVEGLQREKAALDAEAVALVAAAQAGMAYSDALEFARTKAELLTAAQTAGKTITPALTAEIDRLADAHVRAGNAAQKAADDLQAVEERGKAGAEAMAGIFTSVLTGAKSAEEALAALLLQIAQAQMQKLFMNMFGGGAGSSLLGGLLGFADGGYTGAGAKHQPAGVVHRGEFVMSADATRRIGVQNLETLHRAAQKGYADGGLVGSAPTLAKPAVGAPARSGEVAQQISISAPITVNGSAGTPAQNDDLAKKMSRELKDTMRMSIAEELRRQMRPGNQLSR